MCFYSLVRRERLRPDPVVVSWTHLLWLWKVKRKEKEKLQYCNISIQLGNILSIVVIMFLTSANKTLETTT